MILLYLAFSLPAGAAEKFFSSGMYGPKMMVEHVRLESGREVLRVRQVAVNGDKQIVELKLAQHEVVANDIGFRCEDGSGDSFYSVISKKRAKEQDIFPAERAWKINEERLTLDRVQSISKVKCYFAPEGEGIYPFK